MKKYEIELTQLERNILIRMGGYFREDGRRLWLSDDMVQEIEEAAEAVSARPLEEADVRDVLSVWEAAERIVWEAVEDLAARLEDCEADEGEGGAE